MSTGAVLLDRYDVVKVAHHGSADQDPSFYARLRPAVALVSVGAEHVQAPRQETLAMLALVGAQTLRTDQGGLSVVWRDGEDSAAGRTAPRPRRPHPLSGVLGRLESMSPAPRRAASRPASAILRSPGAPAAGARGARIGA